MDADLVLEGGGVKGIGLVGAYRRAHAAGLPGPPRGGDVGGRHRGRADRRRHAAGRARARHARGRLPAVRGRGLRRPPRAAGKALSLLFEKGIYEGRYLRNWLDGLLTKLGARTFGDLRIEDPGSSLPPEKSYRLVVMVSDVTRGELVRCRGTTRATG